MPKFLDVTDKAVARAVLEVGLGTNPTAVKTTGYTAAVGDVVVADATAGGFTVTLPDSPGDKSIIVVKKIDGTSNVVTVQRSGSDVFNVAAGPSTLQMAVPDQSVTVQYASSTGIWHVVANGVSVTSFDDRYYKQDLTGTVSRILDQNGAVGIAFITAASAVNYVGFYNAATGGNVVVRAQGTDDNVGLHLRPRGNRGVSVLNSSNNEVAAFNSGSTPVNYWNFYNSNAGAALPVYAAGTDTNISINLVPKGTGTVQANGVPVASITGTETLTNKSLVYPKIEYIMDTGGAVSIRTVATASAVNYVQVTGTAAAAGYVNFGTRGADTNINLNLTPQGTGIVTVQANPVGVKVAAPASASATGVVGQWAADSSYIYVCTATNTWRRVATETW